MTVKAISAVKLPDGRVEVVFDGPVTPGFSEDRAYYHPETGAIVSPEGRIVALRCRLHVFNSVYATVHEILDPYKAQALPTTPQEVAAFMKNVARNAVACKHVDDFIWEGRPRTACVIPDEVVAVWAVEAAFAN